MNKKASLTQLLAIVLLFKGLVYSKIDHKDHQYLVARADTCVIVARNDGTEDDPHLVKVEPVEEADVLKKYLFGISERPAVDEFMHPPTLKYGCPPEDE